MAKPAIVRRGRHYCIELELELDEAEEVAHALGSHDAGGRELLELVDKARGMADEDADQ